MAFFAKPIRGFISCSTSSPERAHAEDFFFFSFW